jgi:uncharacterized protein
MLIYIERQNNYKLVFLLLFLSTCLFSLAACDKQTETVENNKIISADTEIKIAVEESKPPTEKIIIENKSYVFDVTNHSIEEFQALLTRAEEVSQAPSNDFDDLKIVMVIHGPDIDWFTQKNYEHNRQLIDLAARLDAYDIIDMKVCEQTMSARSVVREDIPSFIESVPYGPTEIKDRLRDGYINL